MTVETDTHQWAYAMSVELLLDELAPHLSLPVEVSAQVRVESGELGCLVVARDLKTQLGPMPPNAGPGTHTIRLIWDTGDGPAQLVFRNHGAGGSRCVFTVESIRLSPAPAGAAHAQSRLHEVIDGDSGRIDLAKVRQALAVSTRPSVHG